MSSKDNNGRHLTPLARARKSRTATASAKSSIGLRDIMLSMATVALYRDEGNYTYTSSAHMYV